MTTNSETPAPHMGKLLQQVLYKKHISNADLARKMNKNRTGVYKYDKRASLQLRIVWHLCTVLKHNFFADLAARLPADYTTNLPPGASANDRIAQLETENRDLKLQLDLLKEVLRKWKLARQVLIGDYFFCGHERDARASTEKN